MSLSAPQWGRIPEALRNIARWCIAGPDKAPYYVPHSGSVITSASVIDPKTWMSFDNAARAAHACGQGIGFICHEDDPFTCIDLDYKDSESAPNNPEKWTTPEQVARSWSIVREFESYTERSRGGKGMHLWVGGKIGRGARRENIEIYSQQRFIICTGDVIADLPIAPGQPLLDKLLEQVRAAQGGYKAELVEQEETSSDRELIERAMYASNAEKFNELCLGKWEDIGFPSQSEADLALMSMFTFYSPSNEQCRRLFRMSKLGLREKAQKNDRYLNFTLQTIRGRQQREEKADSAARKMSEELVARLTATPPPPPPQEAAIAVAAHIVPPVAPPVAPLVNEETGEIYPEKGLQWPPGFAGEIARFIYHSSPRPVREVAIVATLGLLAGICGRAYTIPQSGLNMYIILVARSAIGKEAMHTGLSHIMKFARESVPPSMHFADFNDYASGQALVKKCAENASFVNIAGEWGRKLMRLSSNGTNDPSMASLRTAMTNLYQKSGPTSIVGGLTYSNKENNVASVSGVAYSMIGETTPKTFYEALTEDMMEDGFLSRFTIIEYEGDRPDTNTRQVLELDLPVKEHLGNLLSQACALNARGNHEPVGRTEEAGRIIDEFDAECDTQIRSTTDESWRQMWNRAHLKALRISALLACADSSLAPCIQKQHIDWAISVIRADIAMMSKRIQSGDVGKDDTSRERKILDTTRDYFKNDLPASYGLSQEMKQAGIIPRKFIQIRLQRVSCFINHRLGSIGALDSSLRNLCDSGYFIEMPKDKLVEAYGFHGKCYRVVDVGMTNFGR